MSETFKYKLLSLIRYFGDAFFYPFFSLYLVSTGLVESRIGFILSISPIIGIITNPLYTKICKSVKTTRNVLKIITILEGIMIFAISCTTNFYLISFLVLLMAVFGACHYALLDSLTTVYATSNKINYSTIRIFGSIAYIIAPIVAGYIIKFLGYQASFIIAALVFVITGLLYQMLKPLETLNSSDETSNASQIKTISNLSILKNKKYLFFIIFYMFLMGTVTSTDSFFSMYLESRGISSDRYGLIYAYFVSFEVITIFILNRFFKKANNEILLIISALALIIRLLCNYLYLPVYACAAISALRGIGYGIILHISFQYVVKIVGEVKGTFAIMLMTLFTSLYTFSFNNFNGVIIEKYSYKTFYFINIMLAIIPLLIAIIRYILSKKSLSREVESNV